MSGDFNIQRTFRDRQRVLLACLTGQTHKHPTAIGDKTELHWIETLREFLPRRYQVDRAFVVDSDGGLSQQQDVVIYDNQYSPVIYQDPGGIYLPAEAVYAVFEVKQRVDKRNIEYAGEKAASARRLTRTSSDVHHAGGVVPTSELQPTQPVLAGLLATSARWTDGITTPKFSELVLAADPDERIDLGCALKHGAFEMVHGEQGLSVEVSDPKVSLISFMLRLFARLQPMATAKPLDVRRYGKDVW